MLKLKDIHPILKLTKVIKLVEFRIKEEEKKEYIELSLEKKSDGRILVRARSSTKGDRCGNLVSIGTDGAIHRYCAVNDQFGFVLDSDGKVVIVED